MDRLQYKKSDDTLHNCKEHKKAHWEAAEVRN